MPEDRVWELLARKLSGEASAAELSELDQLLRNHPELHFSIQAITDLWHQSMSGTDKDQPEDVWQRHLARMQKAGAEIPAHPHEHPEENNYLIEGHSRKNNRRLIGIGIAAGVLVIVSLILFRTVFPGSEPRLEKEAVSEILTRNGSKTHISLPDGSQVWLNAGSKLTYDKKFGSGLREVHLTGEAYFDVVKNPDLPFLIHTSRIDIKVLGTAFNVRSYPGEKMTEAALIRGSIEVSFKDRPEKIILKPNEKILVSGDSLNEKEHSVGREENATLPVQPIVVIQPLTIQEKDSSIIETAWVQNRLEFKEETLQELARKMERWYGVTIHITDAKAGALRFTGTFEKETVQQALRALKLSASFSYRFDENGTIIISK